MEGKKVRRIWKRGVDIRPTANCIKCGQPFGDETHEITADGSRHMDGSPLCISNREAADRNYQKLEQAGFPLEHARILSEGFYERLQANIEF